MKAKKFILLIAVLLSSIGHSRKAVQKKSVSLSKIFH